MLATPTTIKAGRVRTRNPGSDTSGQTETLSLISTIHQTWLATLTPPKPNNESSSPHALFTSTPLWSTPLTMVTYCSYYFSSFSVRSLTMLVSLWGSQTPRGFFLTHSSTTLSIHTLYHWLVLTSKWLHISYFILFYFSSCRVKEKDMYVGRIAPYGMNRQKERGEDFIYLKRLLSLGLYFLYGI